MQDGQVLCVIDDHVGVVVVVGVDDDGVCVGVMGNGVC